jgi:hypothetical protein
MLDEFVTNESAGREEKIYTFFVGSEPTMEVSLGD